MAPIPKPRPHTALAIYSAIEAAEAEGFESVGISAGDIGDECERAMFYSFRRVSPPEVITALKRRIFERGNIEEDRLVALLNLAGIEVTDQQARVRDCGGHVRGKIDGQAIGIVEAPATEHIVECKSSKDDAFKALKKDGVQKAKPLHYATIQFYMHKRGLDRALYIVSNKNDEEIYTERVPYDAEFAMRLVARAERIIRSSNPPAKLHEDPAAKMAFRCGYCKHKRVCHEGAWPRIHCRTCLHATPEFIGDQAAWSCARWAKPLTLAEQDAGCPAHLLLPGLVAGEQVDADEDAETVTYRMRDGTIWVDGARNKQEAA